MVSNAIEARGVHAYNHDVPAWVSAMALLCDFMFGLALGLIALYFFISDLSLSVSDALIRALVPVPLIWAGGMYLATWIFKRGRTPGQAIWRVFRDPKLGLRLRSRLSGMILGQAWMGTALYAGMIFAAAIPLSRLPEFAEPGSMEIPRFQPLPPGASARATHSALGAVEWRIQPLYYAVGAWPKSLGGTPVGLAIPYEKGPPELFLGRIELKLKDPEATLIAFGPATPLDAEARETRDCFERGFNTFRFRSSLRCAELKREALKRFRRAGVIPATMSGWDKLEIHTWRSDEERGLWIARKAPGPGERPESQTLLSLLVTPPGGVQGFALKLRGQASLTESSEWKTLFAQALGSVKSSQDLAHARQLATENLERVQLAGLAASGGAAAPALAEIESAILNAQSALAAQASVSPRAQDAFFHLAGTSFLLARKGLEGGHPEWVARARPLFQSAQKYFEDIRAGGSGGTNADRQSTQLAQMNEMFSALSKGQGAPGK